MIFEFTHINECPLYARHGTRDEDKLRHTLDLKKFTFW